MTREIVYTGFVTADGVLDSPGGTVEGHPYGGWVMDTPFDPEAFALKGDEIAETGALLLGRNSYQAFAPIWRDSEDHAAYRDLPKFVVSTTLDEADLTAGWGETRILRSLADVAALKDTEGRAIFIHGSAELARELAAAGLIDRYHLLQFPVLRGAGKHLFPREQPISGQLRLRESEAYPNGVVKLIYEVVR